MRINNNISALNTWRGLSQTDNAMSKSLEKLSSGLRINRASDDAAGLAISEKMRGQIRGLTQASRNAQDGISLIQTAEGALNETHSILQRMRELAVQAATDSNTDADRGQIQKEMEQLKAEVTRISEATEFNTKKLLNGDLGLKVTQNTNNAELRGLKATGSNLKDGAYTITMTAAGTDSVEMGGNSVAADGVMGDYTITTGAEIEYGKYTVTAKNKTSTSVTLELRGPDGQLIKAQDGVALDFNGDFGGLTLDFSTNNITSEGTIELTVKNTGVNVTVTAPDSTTQATGVQTITDGKMSIGGFEFSLKTNHGGNDTTTTLTLTNQAGVLQIGANKDQNTRIAINSMSAYDLGVDVVDVTSQMGANSAIDIIEKALTLVSDERSKLGAATNRLEHTINNLGVAAENLTAAESRIRDVDMAAEMMNFTRQNILSQAGTAMLAQANQRPQAILQLLR